MAQKRKSAPLEASEPNGATLRVLLHYGFLSARLLTTEERTRWAELLPWEPGRVTDSRIITGPDTSQADALGLLVKECAFTFTWLNAGAAGLPWAQVSDWLCTTKAPQYNPPKGIPRRELDPDFTTEGSSPLLAALALVEKRVKDGEWQVMPAGHWGQKIVHAATITSNPV